MDNKLLTTSEAKINRAARALTSNTTYLFEQPVNFKRWAPQCKAGFTLLPLSGGLNSGKGQLNAQ